MGWNIYVPPLYWEIRRWPRCSTLIPGFICFVWGANMSWLGQSGELSGPVCLALFVLEFHELCRMTRELSLALDISELISPCWYGGIYLRRVGEGAFGMESKMAWRGVCLIFCLNHFISQHCQQCNILQHNRFTIVNNTSKQTRLNVNSL